MAPPDVLLPPPLVPVHFPPLRPPPDFFLDWTFFWEKMRYVMMIKTNRTDSTEVLLALIIIPSSFKMAAQIVPTDCDSDVLTVGLTVGKRSLSDDGAGHCLS